MCVFSFVFVCMRVCSRVFACLFFFTVFGGCVLVSLCVCMCVCFMVVPLSSSISVSGVFVAARFILSCVCDSPFAFGSFRLGGVW